MGYEGIYEVSNRGDVKRVSEKNCNQFKSGYFLKLRDNGYGYNIVQLHKNGDAKVFMVHRLVATAFIPNPLSKPHINHLNSMRNDNRVENLAWCTPSENARHKYAMGYKQKQKLTEDEIRYAKFEYENYRKTAAQLSKELNVSVGTVVRHMDLKKGCLGSGNGSAVLMETDIPKIKAMRADGKTYTEIAELFGCSYQTISRVCNGVTWKHVSNG